jgi:hypothetical protein
MKEMKMGLITLLMLLMIVPSCGSRDDSRLAPTLSPQGDLSVRAISDQVHDGGQAGFFWLPPLVGAPTLQGTFDATQHPTVTITPLVSGASAIATYTTTSGPGSETVRVDTTSQNYIVNWHTDQFNLDPSLVYRIAVLVSSRTIGFLDVQVVASQGQAKNVNTSEYVPLVDGRTLPIKWFLNACGTVVCSALDQCHVAGTCDFTSGACSNPAAPDGTTCSSGTCQSGACAQQLSASGTTFQLTQGVLNTNGPKLLVATLSDSLGFADSVSVTIDWGDGSPVASESAGSDGTNWVAWSSFFQPGHFYASVGTFNVTVTFTSQKTGATAVAPSTAVVGPQLIASGATFHQTQGVLNTSDPKLLVATASDALGFADSVSVTIDWGDGSPVSTETAGSDGTNWVAWSSSFQPDHLYAAAGTFNVTVTFTSQQTGATAVAHSTAVVAPQLSASGATFQQTQGVSNTGGSKLIVATATDALGLADSVSVTIDWGDGSPVSTETAGSDGTNWVAWSSFFQPDHSYAAAGTFNVTVTFTSQKTGAIAVANATAQVAAP